MIHVLSVTLTLRSGNSSQWNVAKIHFLLLIIPYTRHALGIIIFNGMTKQDLCPSEEWPRYFTAEWEKISRNRRKLGLWWQNVLSEKSDIQILVLYEIMHLMVISNLLHCPSQLGTVSPHVILVELTLRSLAPPPSNTNYSKNPISLDR